MNKDIISRKDRVTYVPLSKIIPNTHQPRRHFDSGKLLELARSIRENGLLQPITVRRTEGGYMLIAGERRLRASHMAGLTKIPCLVICADERESATLALLENLQRDDLGFFEEAEAISNLMRVCGYTQEAVSKKLGKSQSAISNKLRLLKLGRDEISRISEAGLTERHARALLRLTTTEARTTALSHIIENNLNVYDTDTYIDSLLRTPEKSESRKSNATRRYVIKDMRLFYNTVGKAVDTMRRAGFRTDIIRDENEDCINMNIKIFL